jgi:hypothetical protein
MTLSVAEFPQIFAHRGLWKKPEEQNSFSAIERAFAEGFGVETDIIEIQSIGYISHDTANYRTKPQTDVLNFKGAVALNIKSDDAWKVLRGVGSKIEMSGSFFFDGSGPTMFQISQAGLPFANRISEFESDGHLPAKFLWVDSWSGEIWWNGLEIESWLTRYDHIVLVSPELHQLPHMEYWREMQKLLMRLPQSRISICTDFPEDLRTFLAGWD